MLVTTCIMYSHRVFFFFFKQKTAYEIGVRLVGSEMCIRDRFYRFLCLLYNRVGSFSSRNPGKAVKLVYKVFVHPAYYCRIAGLFSVNTI